MTAQPMTKILLALTIFLSLSFLLAVGCARQAIQTERPVAIGRGLKLDMQASGILDPKNHPEAMNHLPQTKLAYVDWVEAIRQGQLLPRESLEPNAAPAPLLKLDILFKISDAYPIPDVVFPHEPHTMWLACNNCHPAIFAMKQGANPVTMEQILQGEFCGRCHGKVAFPIVDCMRCHSRPKTTTK